jgi:hypothetical protein
MNERFNLMVLAFQHAELLIQAGRLPEARRRIAGLDEASYELALDWYDNEHKDYYYYLVRHVLDTFETESRYCQKEKLEKSLLKYQQKLALLCHDPPKSVFIKGKLLVLQ